MICLIKEMAAPVGASMDFDGPYRDPQEHGLTDDSQELDAPAAGSAADTDGTLVAFS